MVMSSTAERQRNASEQVRQEGIHLRNTRDNRTTWTQHQTDTDLSDRVGDITVWRNTLEKHKYELEQETDLLRKTRDCTEKAYEAKQVPMDVVFECLSLREQRLGTDLVRDEVEAQLQKELEVIDGTKNVLLHKCEEGFEQLW